MLYLFSREFIMRNPIFSFLFFFFLFFGFQHGIKVKLIFNGTFYLWSHGKEFNLIHCFYIYLIMEFIFCSIWLQDIGMSDRNILFLFDLGNWFHICFLWFISVFSYLVIICYLFIMTGEWFMPNWCLNWFMSSWCSLNEGVINKMYNLLHHVLG